MPVHDWSRVDAGLFHHFHHGWTAEIANALNRGILPPPYFALAEQVVSGPVPDVVTLKRPIAPEEALRNVGAVAVADAPPRARFITSAEPDVYASKANRVAIKHRHGHVVAMIEIVSPGNKASQHALRSFVSKAYELISQGINLLIVDLFPPTTRDPQGIHKAIWDEIQVEPFAPPPDKPLTVAAYCAQETKTAYVEPVAVGDELPSLPVFLDAGTYVRAPLEPTYATAWANCPQVLREIVTNARA
jgi:hypothetical protein